MGEKSILDLQNLRHLIGGYETTYSERRSREKENFSRL